MSIWELILHLLAMNLTCKLCLGGKNNFLSQHVVLQPRLIPGMSNADFQRCVENGDPMERAPERCWTGARRILDYGKRWRRCH